MTFFLHFDLVAVRAVIAHAIEHDAQVALVGDSGVYLCSMGPLSPATSMRVRAYAKEADPTVMGDAAHWAKREIWGDDDGAEHFTPAALAQWLDRAGAGAAIKLTPAAVEFTHRVTA